MKATFEYYMRRHGRYYFRNDKSKVSFWSKDDLGLNYGDELILTLQ